MKNLESENSQPCAKEFSQIDQFNGHSDSSVSNDFGVVRLSYKA